MAWGSDNWGGSAWSGEGSLTPASKRSAFGTARPQIRKNKRIGEQELRRIYTGDINLEQIQDNFRDAYNSHKELPFGLPTYIAYENTSAKFGDILLINSNSSINVSLQKATKDDVGKLIIIKNIKSSVAEIKIFPYEGGTIDGSSVYSLQEAYGSVIMSCIDANMWVSSKAGS